MPEPACGRLNAVTILLPEPNLFLYAYVRREALTQVYPPPTAQNPDHGTAPPCTRR